MKTPQTNKDQPLARRRRSYHLTTLGLASLRQSAEKTRPWLLSTGPRTPAGKNRSKLNALKHGERSAESRNAWRELNAALRQLREFDRHEAEFRNSLGQPEIWLDRVAIELGSADRLAP